MFPMKYLAFCLYLSVLLFKCHFMKMKITDKYLYHKSENKEDIVFMLICFLYKQKRINRQSMCALFAHLRANKLLRKIKTYHCPINNKWYHDEYMFNILLDAYDNGRPKEREREMSIEEFISYLQLYHNKNRNYCINLLATSFILPLLKEAINSIAAESILKDWGILKSDQSFDYETVEDKWDLGFGHCCEDCDGNIETYKKYRWRDKVIYFYQEIAKEVFAKLKAMKKENKREIDYLDTIQLNINFYEY